MATAFGATVSLPAEGRSLFFLVGRDGPPDAIARAAGGVVITRLPDGRRILALIPLEAYSALRSHPGLRLAGPVGIDPERFGSFARLVGLDNGERGPPEA